MASAAGRSTSAPGAARSSTSGEIPIQESAAALAGSLRMPVTRSPRARSRRAIAVPSHPQPATSTCMVPPLCPGERAAAARPGGSDMAREGLTLRSTVTLRGGVEMPRFGLGVWQSAPGEETRRAVSTALACGYRHVDTARAYRNEADVGAAIRESGLPRAEVFVTTKLWNADHGHDKALRAIDESLESLGMEQVDLYLVHWPVEGLRQDTWRALEKVLADGKARAIGVSNYTVRHLDEVLARAKEPPAVNQVEFNPFLHQRALLDHCREHGIQLEAY